MIVPYAAGGPVDTVGRIMAQGLGEVLGQQVVVENVGGAGGMTGTEPRREGDARRLHVPARRHVTVTPWCQTLYGKKPLYDPLRPTSRPSS